MSRAVKTYLALKDAVSDSLLLISLKPIGASKSMIRIFYSVDLSPIDFKLDIRFQ